MEMVEVDDGEDVMTTEKMAETAIKVLCAGMLVAMSSLTEFAIGSAEYVKGSINPTQSFSASYEITNASIQLSQWSQKTIGKVTHRNAEE
ncbi:hypothetical protein D5086_031920 [Populus alba]|uniref:Uncharacterized protein n=1 Tax=Populus alba TaxID=43335 RepID=A0ACC4AK10_POPAL